MSGLRTLARLKADERGLVLRTLLLVAAIRIALWFQPFKQLQSLTGSWRILALTVPPDMPISRLVWAVRAASKRIPAASCLTQSLALHYLLTRAGHQSQIRIGVAKEAKAGFRAHAWVEYEGEPLLSSPEEVERYVRVLAVEDKAA